MNRILMPIVFLCVTFFFQVCLEAQTSRPTQEQGPSHWLAGVAKGKITPERRMAMAGYASRKEPSEGTEQDLFAKVLALQDHEGQRMVFITLDLIGVIEPLRTSVTKQVESKFGVKPASLLMNASHTHCGPAYGSSEAADYLAWLTEQLVGLVGQAIGDLAPSSVSYCHARCNFAMNRRTPSSNGYLNHPMPDGPVDPDVPVLRIDSTEGKLKAVLFGYACHNTTMGFLKWLGDYAGYAQQYFEEDHPGTIALFMMGCGGDQNPYPRGQLKYAQFHGRTLATAVESAIEEGQKTLRHRHVVSGPVKSLLETVDLEFASPDRQDAKYPIQTVQFGNDLMMIALGSEATIDYSLRIKRELNRQDGPTIWVAGYSNYYDGYIPSRRVLIEGGYEAQSRPWKPSLEGRILAKVHELCRKMSGDSLFVSKGLTEANGFTEGIEGPACDAQGNLYAVNFAKQQTIGRVSPDGKSEIYVELPGTSVGNGIRFDRNGTMFIADYVGHNVIAVDPITKKQRIFAHDPRMNQPNDLAIADDGTLYASDPNWKEGSGQLWRIDLDGSTHLLVQGMGTTNGIDLSPDGKHLYVNESVQRKIWSFEITKEKVLVNKKLVREFEDHGFDGMRIDVDGNLYVTRHGKGTVVKLSPEGDLLREIDVLGAKPSNICFGGPDGCTAYVTEVEHRRIVSFRVDRPGLEWMRR